MLDLAISVGTDARNTPIIETNHGATLKAPGWPQDCDFQLVAFDPSRGTSEVVPADSLADDIRAALMTLEKVGAMKGRKPLWYRRLTRYAKGAHSARGH